jgi:rhomboid protease GluP
MCRNCGAIVGAGESQCAVCGAAVSPQPAARPTPIADRETIRFARAVLNRPHKFTILFLVVNFFMFLLMWQSSGLTSASLWEFQPIVLRAYGAKLNFLIDTQHQWWRFVTPIFLHGSLIHLLVNMYALWMIGPLVEKLYGSAKFVTFWVLTGIAGVVASYLTVVSPDRPLNPLMRFIFKTQDHPSIGASGALFGLIGVLFVFGIKFRRELPEGFKRAFGTGLLPIIILNLVIGYLGRNLIDNAAHLGGLLSGAALALIVDYRRPGERKSVAFVWRFLQVASLALVVVSFLKVIQHFRETMALQVATLDRPTPQPMPVFLRYFQALREAHETFTVVLGSGNTANLNKALSELEALPSLDENADKLRERMRQMLVRAATVHTRLPEYPAKIPPNLQRELEALAKEEQAWTLDYNEWLKTDGIKHGVTVVETNSNSQQ